MKWYKFKFLCVCFNNNRKSFNLIIFLLIILTSSSINHFEQSLFMCKFTGKRWVDVNGIFFPRVQKIRMMTKFFLSPNFTLGKIELKCKSICQIFMWDKSEWEWRDFLRKLLKCAEKFSVYFWKIFFISLRAVKIPFRLD